MTATESTPTPERQTEDARFLALEREYNITVKALSIAVEQLLTFTGGDSLEIGDAALQAAPDLTAWRDESRRCVGITVSRENAPHGPDQPRGKPTVILDGSAAVTAVDGAGTDPEALRPAAQADSAAGDTGTG